MSPFLENRTVPAAASISTAPSEAISGFCTEAAAVWSKVPDAVPAVSPGDTAPPLFPPAAWPAVGFRDGLPDKDGLPDGDGLPVGDGLPDGDGLPAEDGPSDEMTPPSLPDSEPGPWDETAAWSEVWFPD